MDKKKLKKTLKKIDTTLWIVGTGCIILVVIISLVVSAVTNRKEHKYEVVMRKLEKYNAEHFNYTPEVDDGIVDYLDIKPTVPYELTEYMKEIDCYEIRICNTFNMLCVEITNPNVSIESINETLSGIADLWVINDNGIIYYGSPESGTFDNESVDTLEFSSSNVDECLESLENTILNDNGLVLFYDSNFCLVPVTSRMSYKLNEVWSDLPRSDQIIVMLKLIDELGRHTYKFSNLYSLID